ncbi:MAG: HypC/HybG/HupF family hydrogenase formation chaperone [Methylocella sp.]
MCLAIPAEIVELLDDNMARISIDGVGKVVSVMLVDGLKVGDYVIIHVGFALSKIDPQEARRTLDLFAEIGVNAAELV